KLQEAMLAALFPHHPYGTQTVLGTQEHLKNPSITNIKNYYKTWYVPNNMAICLSGDFNPDEMIVTLDQYFGQLQPNPNLPVLDLPTEEPELAEPIVREVWGLDAETVALAWRFPGASSKEAELLTVLSQVLYNGQAGLIDLDLIQQQKVLRAFGGAMSLSDYSIFLMQGYPKQGQTLDEVKELLLAEVKKLREGDFDEDLLKGTINTLKLYMQRQLEENESRADMFVQSFINDTEWKDEVSAIDRLSKITKEDIVAFANQYLKDTNLAVLYKKQGPDPNEKKIAKPQITPIVMNRDTASVFLKEIQQTRVTPIEPVFLDYSKDLAQLKTGKGIPVLYKKNETNDIFELTYLFDMGNRHDKALGTAVQYLEYLGTADMTPEEVKSRFHLMGCSFSVTAVGERTAISLSGLNENMPQALALLEKLLADAQVDKEAYTNLANDILKSRHNAKLNQAQNFSRLTLYAQWGSQNNATNLLSEAELTGMNPQELVDRVHDLNSYKHRIIYYGPSSESEVLAVLDKEHQTPDALKDIPEGVQFKQQITGETKIFLAPYQAKQIYMSQISNRGETFDLNIEPARQLYVEYFGGGMNSIVFQEMRESRGLAYSAGATLAKPSKLTENYIFRSQIATQNDKMVDAIRTFNDIINNMPESEAAFKLAKEGMISRLSTERVTKESVIWSYINAQELGLDVDTRSRLYNDIQSMTLQDVVNFQQKWVKDRTYYYAILGDKKELDMDALKKLGTVIELKTEDIFGY
ncbi:MAG: insulinase family protein, partial [Bacteroides sp.]|nr:insulinase family protein [Bacteroides sp.]